MFIAGAALTLVLVADGKHGRVESGDEPARLSSGRSRRQSRWQTCLFRSRSLSCPRATFADKKEFGIQAKGNDRETAITYDEALSYVISPRCVLSVFASWLFCSYLRSQDVKDIEVALLRLLLLVTRDSF